MAEYQPSLLSHDDLRAAEVSWAYNGSADACTCSVAELRAWKQRVWQFQQAVRDAPTAAQGDLFAIAAQPTWVETLDPLTLPQRNAEFWRGQFSDAGTAALYFVVDHTLPILLYVGETLKANQRWKGTHDCKRYILNYIATHRAQDLPVAVNIGFWPHAPEDRKARQQLESELIYKWRSPFNKENWRFWGTPFVSSATE